HNTARAQHPGGLWDLGDSGSFLFKALEFQLKGAATDWQLQAEQNTERYCSQAAAIHLQQHSSGGENWQSPNHVTASGAIPFTQRGYTINNGEQHFSGLRAEPVAAASNELQIQLAVPHFWQKFPQALALDADGIKLALFAQQASEPHELQGGEKSSRELWLQFTAPTAATEQASGQSMRWVYQQATITLAADYYVKANSMPWLNLATDDPLASCILPPDNFFAKREVIDEYGWRNFGDIFADHETLYQAANEAPYISHYNNQYDAIYGFCRQYLLSGDRKWFELMDDLAKHVTDIDIYDTDEDREEYNHGLFWHTDHYLPAETATHRTYSKLNTVNGRSTAGGGPGPEHCYTTGLTYHYWLTGNEASKQAVLKLADWITTYHEGSNCFLSQLLAIKNTHLPRLIDLFKGKPVLPHTYAFTRGTGNYITALLDSYLLSQDRKYLNKVEQIIKNVIHPNDDINARDLLNVEVAWSYLICLTSIARYVDIKSTEQQFDYCYAYAKESFLHYARWIRDHEQAFLADV
ncbi:MAG: hypothetical protein NWQ54_16675, partial [Paraglaciecola sp.]|nr:hypothetical protein [Paraglaciecola sp.]